MRTATAALAALAAGCVSIRGTAPDPLQASQHADVQLGGVFGPSALEPGARVRFDGQTMALSPNTSSQVGFTVPSGTSPGSHKLEVYDPPGLLEILSIVLLLRDRDDEQIVEVQGPPKVVNMVPAALSGESNQDSEPFLAVHPRNPAVMVGSAFTPNPGTAATTAPIYFSQDGGTTWALVNSVPSQGITGDITYAFDRDGPERGTLYTGILRVPGGLVADALSTDDAGAVTTMTLRNTNQNTDQPFVVATSSGGQDRVYIGNNDFDAAPNTATVDFSQNGGANWTSIRLESRNSFNQDGPSVRPAIAPGSVVYAAYFHRTASAGQIRISDVVVARDDDGATGAIAFRDLLDSGDALAGQLVVQGVSIPWNAGQALGQERIGSTLSIAADPNNAAVVYVAWADRVGNGDIYTIHVRNSTDSGQTWSNADLRTITNATCVSLAIASNGTIGLLYQQLTNAGTANARWETHLEQTRDAFQTIQDTTLATTPANVPVRVFGPYLGDYNYMVASGSAFRGVFSANNTPDLANFPQGVVYQRSADFTAHTLNDGAGNVAPISIDPFYFSVQVLR